MPRLRPRPSPPRDRGTDRGGAVLAASVAAEASLAFREPAEGAALVGEVEIIVTLTPADLAGVQLVMTVDGRELCTLQRPPWSCTWDAGPRDARASPAGGRRRWATDVASWRTGARRGST